MIEGYTIVCDSNIPWNRNRYSKHHIMSRLAKKNRVIFVDPPRPLDAQVGEYGLAALAGRAWRPGNESLTVLSPSELPWKNKFDFVMNTADPKYFVAQIKHALGRYDPSKLILFLGNPWNTFLLDAFPDAACTVYHCSDNFPEIYSGQFRSVMENREKAMITNVTVPLAITEALFDKCKSMNTNAVLFKHGVDEHFYLQNQQPLSVPEDISRISPPIIGYVGMIDAGLDYNLLEYVVSQNAGRSFVFIGPVTDDCRERLKLLIDGNTNMHYLGAKPWTSLPAYLKPFAVCLIPWICDGRYKEFVRSRFPLKLLEYKASGKMVVSTVPVDDSLKEHVMVSQDRAVFSRYIDACLTPVDRAAIQARITGQVSGWSWGARVEELCDIIERYVAK